MSSLGVSAFLANSWLNTLRNTPYVAPITAFQLHLGIPGAAGTANPSTVTTRVPAIFSAGIGGSVSFTGALPVWAMTTGETITHISVWDALTSGNFLVSGVLNTPEIVANGDQFALAACTLFFTTLAS